MKGSVEYAFVARELIVRTKRHLVVLMLPLVCWLAAQECPTQALLGRCSVAQLCLPRSGVRPYKREFRHLSLRGKRV